MSSIYPIIMTCHNGNGSKNDTGFVKASIFDLSMAHNHTSVLYSEAPIYYSANNCTPLLCYVATL